MSSTIALEKAHISGDRPLRPKSGGYLEPMSDFGALARSLREKRGWSQAQLAARAGVSGFTIRRGEASAKCVWKRSTVGDVLRALDQHTPVSEAEAREYLLAGGLSENFLSAARRLVDSIRRESMPQADPLAEEAMHAARLLIDRAGPDRVLTVLQALSAAWGLPVSKAAGQSNGPRALVRETIEDAHRVREYVPISEETIPRPTKPRASKLA